jgi:polyisoprenyl-phosphate glycosyltransferase
MQFSSANYLPRCDEGLEICFDWFRQGRILMQARKTIEIIVPIYNEAACVDTLIERLMKIREMIVDYETTFLLVDDGSHDESVSMIEAYAAKHDCVRLVKLSRNFGHQIAISAGLDFADADYVAIIDADLQDPPEVILDMLIKAEEGYDVIYGKRATRKGESALKLLTAKIFYALIRRIGNIDIPSDTGDFRLMSRRVVKAFRQLREKHRFVRGMIPWIGYETTCVEYHREERMAGETKYPMRKMVRFACDAIFSFSNSPLRFATYLGFGILGICSLGGLAILYLKFFTKYHVPGITAVLMTILIIGGCQILLLGVCGEYIGRIFEESKDRPLYFVDRTVNVTISEGHDEPDSSE